MAFRLCLALGCPHPDYLLEKITLKQLYEWQMYASLEPFGFPMLDMMQARQMWASLRSTSDKSWAGQPGDFLISKPDEVEKTVDPVEYLTGFFGVGPPPRPPSEVE